MEIASPDPAHLSSAAPLSGRRRMAAVALAVFLVHLTVLLVVPAPGSFGKYPLAARQLAAGILPEERRIDFSPLYLGLHRLALPLEAIVGPLEGFVPVVQVALLAWAVAATSAAAARHLGAGPSLAFAALFAFDRQVFVYVRVLEPEILLLALLATWLYCLDRGPGRPESRRRDLALAGTAAALAFATRPTFLPVFLLVAPLFLGWRDGFRPFSSWLRQAGLFLAPLFLAALLLGLRAADATGDFRAPAMNPGTVFYEGHQPLATGISARYPPAVHLALRAGPGDDPDPAHRIYREIARAESGDPALSITRVNDFWAGRAAAFLGDQPALAAQRALRQLRYAVHAYAFHDVSLAKLYEERLWRFFVPFSLLAACAAWGVVVAAPGFRQALLFYAILAAQLGVMTLFYVSARQRLVLLPALAFFAVGGVLDLRRRGGRGVALGLLLALLGLALALRDPAMDEDLHGRLGFSAALERRDQIEKRLAGGASVAVVADQLCAAAAETPWRLEEIRPADYPQDRESFEACVARRLRERLEGAPGWRRPFLEFDLAGVELAQGRLAEAEALLRSLAAAGRRFPREGAEASSPRLYLARIAFLRGQPEAARQELTAGLAEAPGEPFLLADLEALGGDPASAGELLRYYSRLDHDWLVGQALLFYGRPEEARAALAAVAGRLPEARRPRLELAIALAALGRDEEALEELERAYQGPPEPCAQASRVLPLLERLAGEPCDLRRQLRLGALFFRHGAYARAASLLGPALSVAGSAAPPELRAMLAAARQP